MHRATSATAESAAIRGDGAWLAEGAAWTPAAPVSLVAAARSQDAALFWRRWTEHLAARRRPRDLAWLLGAPAPLDWGFRRGAADRGGPLVEKGRKAAPPAVASALMVLGECHALPALARQLSPRLWWERLDQLRQTAVAAGSLGLAERPLEHQLLGGELPLSLAFEFPELALCQELALAARRALSRGVVELLDENGLPHWSDFPLLRPLLACWTRCRAMEQHSGRRCFSDAARARVELLLLAALRLTRSDGTQVFSVDSESWDVAFVEAALRLSAAGGARRLARHLALCGRRRPARRASLPKPSFRSQWSQVAVLQGGWSPRRRRLAVAHGDGVYLDAAAGKHTLILGEWTLALHVDGRPAAPTGDWEETCWICNRDVAYLALRRGLTEGRRVERQVLMCHEDRCALLADAILGSEPARLEYAAALPLAPGAQLLPAQETRDVRLATIGRKGAKPRAVVLPLALAEWQMDPRPGSLAETRREGRLGGDAWSANGEGSPAGSRGDARRLVLRQSTHGANLFAPLWLDWKRGRLLQEYTWRQLTVAERRRVQRPDQAVGYRVQAGAKQWLVYRSLIAAGNRTLLGCNLVSTFLVARFDANGQVEPLVEIE